MVLRGQGHKSWVSVVAFDPFNMSYGAVPDGLDFSGSDEECSAGSAVNNGAAAQTQNKSFLQGGGNSDAYAAPSAGIEQTYHL